MMRAGEKLSEAPLTSADIITQMEDELREVGFTPDQLFIQDADTLGEITTTSKRAVILMAAWLGQTRLIDNLQLDLPIDIA
jgi:pantoate--beta-alanine ligase